MLGNTTRLYSQVEDFYVVTLLKLHHHLWRTQSKTVCVYVMYHVMWHVVRSSWMSLRWQKWLVSTGWREKQPLRGFTSSTVILEVRGRSEKSTRRYKGLEIVPDVLWKTEYTSEQDLDFSIRQKTTVLRFSTVLVFVPLSQTFFFQLLYSDISWSVIDRYVPICDRCATEETCRGNSKY
jgi:hypothetical protein